MKRLAIGSLAGSELMIEEAKAGITALMVGYPQQSVIFYGPKKINRVDVLLKVREAAEDLGALCEYIDVTGKTTVIDEIKNSITRLGERMSIREESGEDGDHLYDSYTNISNELTDRLVNLGTYARSSNNVICYFINEMNNMNRDELEALIIAIHRVNQKSLPIMIFGSGSTNIIKKAGILKPYSERLFRMQLCNEEE